MITNAGLNRVLQLLDAELTHIAIGTGNIPTNISTKLSNEAVRKTATSFTDGFTLIKELFLDENEGNGVNYTNTGVFGNGATNTVDTGELFAGGSISVAKNNTQSLTVSIELTVEGVS